MAKQQSKLRDAVDVIFAPADYLTIDGAPAGYSKLSQRFKKLAKPENLTLIASSALAVKLSPYAAAQMAFVPMIMMPGLYFTYKGIADELFEGNYYDTKGAVKSFVDTDKATGLYFTKFAAGMLSGSFASLTAVGVAAEALSDEGSLRAGAAAGLMLLPFIVQNFGHFWRSKQVLDGNWSITDSLPPAKSKEGVEANLGVMEIA